MPSITAFVYDGLGYGGRQIFDIRSRPVRVSYSVCYDGLGIG